MPAVKILTRTIWILAIVSLLNDVASEMLYPMMPLYLKSIGFTVVAIGVLEGVAEAIAGISKIYFGRRSDRTGRRAPFIQLGYALSACAKPLLAVSRNVAWIFFARTSDRLGKGVRTGARDGMLNDNSTRETKGRVFGFHRTADTIGAVLGPISCLVYLKYHPGDYRALFLIAFIPGALSSFLTLILKDRKRTPEEQADADQRAKVKVSFFNFLEYWKRAPVGYRHAVGGLLAFALFNSSDYFLLLKMKEAGLTDVQVIGAYIFYNIVYAVASYPLGVLGDKIGLKRTLLGGLMVFATIYAAMAFTHNLYVLYVLFFLYGLYAAANDGVASAWISNLIDRRDTATAMGTYSAFGSLATMVASIVAGAVWYQFGAKATFLLTAAVTLLVVLYFIIVRTPDPAADAA